VAEDLGSGGGRAPHDESYAVRLSPLGETIMCRPDETVLGAILRGGAKIIFGCRGGGCGSCKMRVISGRVEHGRCSAAVLTEEEKEKGSFLSCQARPLSDLTVELTARNKYRRPMAEWLRGKSY
jgi:CDP-4-dehydro-6-deoxyglucose reductase, E3